MIHSVVIELAEKFIDLNIEEIITDPKNGSLYFNKLPWEPTVLSFGYPSLILFYSQLYQIDQNIKWKKIAHKFIEKTLSYFESGVPKNISMFGGLSGVCFTIWTLSEEGKHYKKLLGNLDNYFFQILDNKISNIKNKVFLNTEDYDCIQGLSGILRYILLRRNENQFSEYACKIVDILNSTATPIDYQNFSIPKWYLNINEQLLEQDKIFFANGSFNLGLAHGATAILAALSLAKLSGINRKNTELAISNITKWILKWKMVDKYGSFWPGRVSFEEEVNQDFSFKNYQINRQAWCYGTPGVARSLLLAAKALSDKDLEFFSVHSFLEIIKRPEEEWQCYSPTFCHGYAGILQISKRIYQDTLNPVMLEFITKL